MMRKLITTSTIVVVILVISFIGIKYIRGDLDRQQDELINTALAEEEESEMTKELFWEIIGYAKKQSGTNLDLRFTIIRSQLWKYSCNDILQFGKILKVYRLEAESNTALKCACRVIEGNINKESFSYFCLWLISEGEDIYYKALEDPDSLATQETKSYPFCSFEELPYAPYSIFTKKSEKKNQYNVLMSDREFEVLHKELFNTPLSQREKILEIDESEILKLIPETVPKLVEMYKSETKK